MDKFLNINESDNEPDIYEFVHPEPDSTVTAVGGHYTVTGVHRISIDDSDILYISGAMMIDTSCCGVGGCGFLMVAGEIVAYASGVDSSGRIISRVKRITNSSRRESIQKALSARHPYFQVSFL